MLTLYAQVIDLATGLPLDRVNVFVPGGIGVTGIKYGTTTDAAGFFTLQAEPEEQVIISHIGYNRPAYQAKDLVGENTIYLKPVSYQLDEVTVTPQTNTVAANRKFWAMGIGGLLAITMATAIVRRDEIEKATPK